MVSCLVEIEAIAGPVSGRYSSGASSTNTTLVYAVFQSPLAGLKASAICAFDMSHIAKIFASPSFSSPPPAESRPGSCVNDSRTLSEEAITFIRLVEIFLVFFCPLLSTLTHSSYPLRNHPLIEDSVSNFFGAPLAIYEGVDRYTQIVIDPQVTALDGRHYDIIYVGTDTGYVHKLVNIAGAALKSMQATVYTASIKAIAVGDH